LILYGLLRKNLPEFKKCILYICWKLLRLNLSTAWVCAIHIFSSPIHGSCVQAWRHPKNRKYIHVTHRNATRGGPSRGGVGLHAITRLRLDEWFPRYTQRHTNIDKHTHTLITILCWPRRWGERPANCGYRENRKYSQRRKLSKILGVWDPGSVVKSGSRISTLL